MRQNLVARIVGIAEQLISFTILPLLVISAATLVLLLCDSKHHQRFEDDDADSPANKQERESREKLRKKVREERKRMNEGLLKGQYRPADNNETVNEVVSNWGVAQAKAAARGLDDYFDNRLEKGESASKGSNQSSEEYIKKSPFSPQTPPNPPPARTQQGLRPRDDNETINEVVSNWGAAQAMLQQRNEQPPVPTKPSPPAKPPPMEAQPKFRPRNDNETINEVVSNWGAAQAMLQQRNEQPPVATKPPPPGKPRAMEAQQKFRPRNDDETINEVVSNWGAAQKIMQKKFGT